ncbi:hypothetical protein ACQY1Q_10480 [Tenacibaculum sp. TC6]|uniref:hypothetical protein n=1 Tax=Tenacibaculum sp. TC6 TaxID=3423223 RepID=UPI003D35ECC5
MSKYEETDEREELFAQEFPSFYQFITKEIQMLEFASDLALCYQDEDSSKDLNERVQELRCALGVLTKLYAMDLFE